MTKKFDKNWNIVPIITNSKRPALEHISDWYNKQYPREDLKEDGNFAVICGATSDNLVVLDLDYAKQMNYIKDIFPTLSRELGQIVQTYTEHSPNGAHLFYKLKGKIPKSKNNTNSNVHDLKDIIKEYVSGKRKTLSGLKRIVKTINPEDYHSIDVLGQKKYCLIQPSVIDGREYKEGLPFPVKTITREEFDKLVGYFLLEKIESQSMRNPFTRILNGKIEIESYAKEQGMDEHVYWSGLFKEAWNFLGLTPDCIYPLLEKNQPSFDLNKTETQLNSGSHNYDDKPIRNETLSKYFPFYKVKKQYTKSDKTPVYIEIADYLMNKYDIVTLRDQKETILIRNGNIYSNKLEGFFKEIADQVKFHGKSMTQTSANILKTIRYSTYFDTNSLCYDNWVISFSNGYYDVEKEKFYPNDKSTNKAFCYEIPHNYNPKFEGDCTKFKKLLADWIGDSNIVNTDDVFEMMGYSMMMNTDMKMAFFIYGESHTGKTQFQTILEHVIGHPNRCEVSLQRMCKDHFGSHGMQFKLLNMIGDMSGLNVNDASEFKKLTGGDKWVGAEMKGGKQYEFRNIVKIWCNGNKIPVLSDDDGAFYERWILINFPNVYKMYDKDTIKDIGAKLCKDKNEIQAIIHECIKGLKRLYERQYFRQEVVENTEHLWKYQAEPLYAFLYDNYVFDGMGEVSSYDFRSKFNRYLIKKRVKPTTVHKLNAMMENHGYYIRRSMRDGDRENYYIGLMDKDEHEAIKKREEELFISGRPIDF